MVAKPFRERQRKEQRSARGEFSKLRCLVDLGEMIGHEGVEDSGPDCDVARDV